MRKIELDPPEADMTALQHLRASLPDVAEKYLRAALQRKDVRADGVRLRGNDRLRVGAPVTVFLPDDAFVLPIPTVVYEDSQLLVCDKPQGLIVENHAGGDSLSARVQVYGRAQGFSPRLCHRLDAGTGGLVIFAKTDGAHAVLYDLLKRHALRRFYEAIVQGAPHEGRLSDGWIKGSPRVKIVAPGRYGSAPCETVVRVLLGGGTMSRIEAEIITGRTHQIRAQLAHHGHPVLGDDVYGSRAWNRQMGARCQQLFSTRFLFPADMPEPLQYLSQRQLPAGGYDAAQALDAWSAKMRW